MSISVAVVTPTIGTEHLSRCVRSIQNQIYENLIHYIFLDGQEHYEKIHPVLYDECGKRVIKTISLEDNIGKGWYGHRVYAACSFLVNADVIIYLDEDNWLEPCHVEKMVNRLNEGFDWVYSLRKIYDKTGNYLLNDNCESLGKWPVYFDDNQFHIDTSCYAVRRDVAIKIGHSWYGQWGADRQFFRNLKHFFPKYECTNAHTLCYRLDGNPNSVTEDFFKQGNKINEQKYNGKFPWLEKQRLLQVAPGISVVM
jgi:glycosyltransferase involved in cell wall biosynthesis